MPSRRDDFDLAPMVSDLVAAGNNAVGRELIGRAQLDRAGRAGVEVRLRALGAFKLTKWKEALTALAAVTVGILPSDVSHLITLCCRVGRKADAESVFAAYELALGEKEQDYVAVRVIKALDELTSGFAHESNEAILRRIAKLCGLVAENTRFAFDSSGPAGPGYYEAGRFEDLEATLARGGATFSEDALSDLLAYWAALAYPFAGLIPAPPAGSGQDLIEWIDLVENTSNRRLAHATAHGWDVGDGIMLDWVCQEIPGRKVRIKILHEPSECAIMAATMVWQTGTGRPDPDLRIEQLLALPGCSDFHPVGHEAL